MILDNIQFMHYNSIIREGHREGLKVHTQNERRTRHEKNYEQKTVYRVWYGKNIENEAFFTEKEAAKKFAEAVDGHMNIYLWEMQIEE